MKCNNCSVNISYKTDKCPICGASVTDSGNLPEFFPKPPHLTKNKINKISINFVALLAILAICLVMLIVNLFTFKNTAWALIATLCVLLAYFVLSYSFKAKHSLACRNVFTFALALATFYCIGFLTALLPSITLYIMPNLFTLFTLVNCTALVILNRQKYFFSTMFFAVIGLLPLVLALCNLPVSLIPAIAGAVVSLLAFTLALALNFKKLKLLVSSYFHF